MIKLERGTCPKELNEEVKEELTKLYKENKEKDVWNSPKIKKPLKDALIKMTNDKCAYCECVLNVESKDLTIDHFLPKSTNEDIVIEWTNLLPSCLRCNRSKNRSEEIIIDPCNIDPKEHIGVKKESYRLKALNDSIIGGKTIKILKLNDIERVIKARCIIVEKIIEKLEDLLEDVKEDIHNIKPKHVERLERFLEEGLNDKEYSAVVSSKILNDDIYNSLKDIYEKANKWSVSLQRIEDELKRIALKLI